MGYSNQEIGWSRESTLLQDILKGLNRLTVVVSNISSGGGGSVNSVIGTLNRVTSTGGTDPVIDISTNYIGQASITTVGTLIAGATGAGFTINLIASTISGDLPFANLTQGTARSVLGITGNAIADFASIQGSTDQILRINSAGTALSFGSIDLSKSAAVGSTILGSANGGTGVANNAASTLTISGNFATTLTVTGATSVTLPTTGTLLNSTQAWLAASGTTLTGNNTITQAGFATTFSGIGKVTFSPTSGASSVSGFNFGSVSAAPSTLANGDGWYDSTNNVYTLRQNGATVTIGVVSALQSSSRVAFFNGTSSLTGSANFTFVTNRLSGSTLYLTVSAGAAAAGNAPLKMTSGTNLTTAENGAFEYNGTNLFFTRAGAVRENIICESAVNSVSPTAPNRTITVNIDGTTYYLHAKTTND